MKIRGSFLALALVAAVAATACGSSAAAAATVNGQTISRSEFERELRALRDNKELAAAGGEALKGTGKNTVSAELSAGWLTALIYDAVITEEFERRELELDKAARDEAEAQLGTQFGDPKIASEFPDWFRKRLIDRNARATAVKSAVSGISTSEESLRQYYDEHKDEFGQVCLSHILVETKAEADAVVAQVKGKDAATFAAVAKDKSKDPGSAQNGGDLGCNPRGIFVDEFDKAAFSLPLNEVSDPVQTRFGYHVLLVKDRTAAPFEQARAQVKATLSQQGEQAFRDFLEKAVADAKITVDERYGTFESGGEGQAPQVVPPDVPQPNDSRPEAPAGDGTGGAGSQQPGAGGGQPDTGVNADNPVVEAPPPGAPNS